MGEVINLSIETKAPIPPEKIISGAAEQKFDRVIVIGVLEDGTSYLAFSDPDGGHVVWDMERAKYALMKGRDDG